MEQWHLRLPSKTFKGVTREDHFFPALVSPDEQQIWKFDMLTYVRRDVDLLDHRAPAQGRGLGPPKFCKEGRVVMASHSQQRGWSVTKFWETQHIHRHTLIYRTKLRTVTKSVKGRLFCRVHDAQTLHGEASGTKAFSDPTYRPIRMLIGQSTQGARHQRPWIFGSVRTYDSYRATKCRMVIKRGDRKFFTGSITRPRP